MTWRSLTSLTDARSSRTAIIECDYEYELQMISKQAVNKTRLIVANEKPQQFCEHLDTRDRDDKRCTTISSRWSSMNIRNKKGTVRKEKLTDIICSRKGFLAWYHEIWAGVCKRSYHPRSRFSHPTIHEHPYLIFWVSESRPRGPLRNCTSSLLRRCIRMQSRRTHELELHNLGNCQFSSWKAPSMCTLRGGGLKSQSPCNVRSMNDRNER